MNQVIGTPPGYKYQSLSQWGPLFAVDDEAIFGHPWFSDLEPTVVGQFKLFHVEHKGLLELYAKYARDLKASGKKHFGIKAIAERVRWYMTVERAGTADENFKVNNNFTSCYARFLMLKYPELDGMFELRTSHGE